MDPIAFRERDLPLAVQGNRAGPDRQRRRRIEIQRLDPRDADVLDQSRRDRRCHAKRRVRGILEDDATDRKSTRLNSSHGYISYAVFCLKKKKKQKKIKSKKRIKNITK